MTNWLTGWGYRQSHIVSAAAGAGTGYQIKIKVHSGAGSSSTDDVYLKGHCSSFPNDIEFTTDDGTTPLDFWIENPTADPCTVWVEVAGNLSSVDKTIYIYYGKADQSSLADGTATFPFFDDFSLDNNTLDTNNRWTVDSGSWSVSSNHLLSGSVDNCFLRSKSFTMQGGRVRAKLKLDDATNSYWGLAQRMSDSIIFVWSGGSWNGANNIRLSYWNSGSLYAHTGVGPTADTNWHIGEYTVADGGNQTGSVDDSDAYSYASPSLTNSAVAIRIGGSNSIECAWFFASKYVSPEPANSTWGAEEALILYTVSGVTRDSSGDPLGDCDVYLYDATTKTYIASTTSDVSTGAYSFTSLVSSGPYFVVAFKSGSPDVMGITDNNLTGV